MRPEASDGYDRWDTLLVPGPRAYFGTYHTMGVDGWEGPTGFYQSDWRVPYGELGQSKTWRFYVWADPLLPAEATIIGVNLGSNGVDGLRVTLTLRDKPSVVVGGPVSGTTWTLPPFGRRVDLPVYRTDNGLEGYVFDLTATVVPEPSSLLALSAGLAGLAGARRRAGAG